MNISVPIQSTGAVGEQQARSLSRAVGEGAAGAAKVAVPRPVVGKPVAEPADRRRETLEAVARELERYVESNGRNLKFNVDDSAKVMVVQVRHASSGELIRQYPSEEALALMSRLNEGSGTLLDLMA